MLVETEIKLAVDNLLSTRTHLQRFGWCVATRRKREINWILDCDDSSLRHSNRLLRIRRSGSRAWLTVKGPPEKETVHKVKKEFETEIPNAMVMLELLAALDYRVVWRYEKYRTGFTKANAPGIILLDETPIGNFLELEGPSAWIDKTAARLGFTPADYITHSYRHLFEEEFPKESSNSDMLFND